MRHFPIIRGNNARKREQRELWKRRRAAQVEAARPHRAPKLKNWIDA